VSTQISKEFDKLPPNALKISNLFTFLFLEIHNARPHSGQKLVASRLRSLLHSEVYKSEVAGT